MGHECFVLVIHLLRECFYPEQIAGKLCVMKMNFKAAYVCRETIDNAIYALLVGQLRKELIQCPLQRKRTRRSSSGGIHMRAQEIERLMPGQWEGNLSKGKDGSAVGTLAKRTNGCLILIKMIYITATSAVEKFSAELNSMPLAVRKA